MKIFFPIILWISFILTSCGVQKATPIATETQPISQIAQETPKNDSTPTSKTYTAAEVGTHATKGSCWLILDNDVYDVTSFISRHPGGDKILRGCGKDATQMFSQHPESAKAMKEQFKIGDLTQ